MIQTDIRKNTGGFNAHFALQCQSRRIVLFGPSGSGKSTLLKMVAGLCLPDQGNITVNNRIIFDQDQGINVPVHQRCFGYLPQDYTLFPNMTVKENILYGLRVSNIPFTQDTVAGMASKLGITAKLQCRPSELSGGQQQRAALARIMLINPRALLLDEPFSALDRRVREALRDLVRDLTTDLKIPTLLVTHDIEDAHAFAREIVIIKDGSVLEYGNKKDVLHSPRFVETARLFDFQVFPLESCDSSGFLTLGGEHLTLNAPIPSEAHYACIRPENILLLREDKVHHGGLENVVSGKVLRLHPRSAHVKITFCSMKGEEYIIHAPNHVVAVMDIHPGKKIRISL
ncbi:MAG: ATP-binding cassette domain-containing protein, partial [Desulfobulbaceae bacterium]|nr:ATP-binding cassette domain-containing protein [Desulfobulbaceae bacterium]